MRYLVISDLHANLEALQAVLEHARGAYDQIICCGDVVGYGPEPGKVINWTRQNVQFVIRGNHDRACCGLEDLEWFNPTAQVASLWTRSHLQEQEVRWLRDLPQGPLLVDGFGIAHGSPLDEDEYVTSAADAANLFDYLDTALTFYGHTHLQGGFCWLNGRQRSLDSTDRVLVQPEGTYLVNPGSVGQPRDGDARAAYALYDRESGRIDLRRAGYDFEAVCRKIELAGLPPVLGTRLGLGR